MFAQQAADQIPAHHLSFSNKPVTISDNGSHEDNETDDEDEDMPKFKINWNHVLITKECGVAQRPPSPL